MVPEIDSEGTPGRTTVAPLLPLKLSVDEDCFSFKPPKALFEINTAIIESDVLYGIVINIIFVQGIMYTTSNIMKCVKFSKGVPL